MPQGGRGKFLLNGVVATRQGPRRQVARHERLQWGEAVSQKGTHARDTRLTWTTIDKRQMDCIVNAEGNISIEILQPAVPVGRELRLELI